MENFKSDKPILVTGATGYVASWIIYKLLEAGNNVRGTVRKLVNKQKYQHLTEASDTLPGTFTPFEADLLKDGSFKEPMEGCEIVIHTASPFKTFGVKNPQKELIEPAIQGTRNVLNSVNQVESVKKVVLTASVVSIYGDSIDIEKTEGRVFNEEHWNKTSSPSHQPYPYSKVAAEKEAWKMADQQERWKMATIHPGFVLGPSKTGRLDSTSIDFMKGMVQGKLKSGIPELYFGIVDVRDVADAHIKSAFNPDITGRFITVAGSMGMLDIAKSLGKTIDKKLPLPTSYLPKSMIYLFGPLQGLKWSYIKKNVGIPIKFDNSKSVKELGLEYIPLDTTLKEHAEQILEMSS